MLTKDLFYSLYPQVNGIIHFRSDFYGYFKRNIDSCVLMSSNEIILSISKHL